MRIVWVARSFLDYRIPVFQKLFDLTDGNLFVIYSKEVIPQRTNNKVISCLGENAIGLSKEFSLGESNFADHLSNSVIRIVFQPDLMKRIIDLSPDVIVSEGFFQWTIIPLWLKITKRIPNVICYERTAHTERNASKLRTFYRKFASFFTDAICCSGSLCSEYVIKRLGYNKAYVTSGHLVADVDYFFRSAGAIPKPAIEKLKLDIGASGTIFLYVGRLIKRKGLDFLLNAWLEFGRSNSLEKTLIIVGGGKEKNALSEFCRIRNIKNVRFIGEVDYDSLPVYYRAADIFITPTLEDNWSLVVSEAMACGLPIICSKYNGSWPELVSNENGWFFDPLDNPGFVNILNECIRNRGEFSRMGEASIRIIKKYNPASAADSILRACKIAIERRSAEKKSEERKD